MIANKSGAEEVRQSLSDLWAPARTESVCDWVEQNVELPSGAITGKVQLRYIPYAKEILERYADKSCRHLVMCMPTQAAKSTILICGALYKICRDPEDGLWVFGNGDQARDFSKERLQPFVALCKPAFALVPKTAKGLVDKHLFGFLNQHYQSMVLNLVGAGSTTNLSSRPRGFLQLDEVDKYHSELRFDAGTIQLAEERQKTFPFPICVKASSPTTSDRMIWTELGKTDWREYWMPCPRCEQKILFRFKIKSEDHGRCGVRWWHENEEEAKTDGAWDMKKVKALAHYRCQCCGGMIHDFERHSMLECGEWVPSRPNAESGRFGYHLNSIYSVLSQQTGLGQIATQFLIAQGLRSELQNFINGWLAEPFDESSMYEDKEVHLEAFENKDIPRDGTIPIMGIDNQQGHAWAVIRRFEPPSPEFPHGQSWLLYADRVETDDELVELQKEYGVEGVNVLSDMAWRPAHVGKLILKNDWRGIVGTDTKEFTWVIDGRRVMRPYSVPQFRDAHLGTSWESRTFQRVRFIKFSKPAMLDLVSSLRFAKPTIFHITVNANPAYARHLNSRVKRMAQNKRTGRMEFIWWEKHQDNHLFDAEVFCAVRAMQLGLLSAPNETDEVQEK